MKFTHRILILLAIQMLGSFTMLKKQTSGEYNVKAAFVYKFTNYIEWDAGIKGDEFVICILGPSPITEALMPIARANNIKGKKVVIRNCLTADEIDNCHILFISQKSLQPLTEVLNKIPKQGVLTISEKDGFAAAGTSINFIVVDNRLRFEANPKAIYSSGLTVSSQLLKLAVLVN